MSALPKAVKAQIDKANEILDDMNKPPEGDPPAGDPPKDPPADPPAGNAPPADPPAGDPPKDPPAGDPPAASEKGWEHKYNVLQGKYNAEVPRLQKNLSEAQDLIKEMRQRQNNLESMLASIKTTQAEPPKTPEPPKPRITQEEIDAFGPDLTDFINRAAQDVADRIVAERMKGVTAQVEKVEKTTGQVSQKVAESDQDRMLQKLASAVPNWAELNEDKEFIKWLDVVDPYVNQKRGVLLRHAVSQNDAERVIAFFKGYLNENAAVTPETTPTTPEGDPPAGDPPAGDPPKEPQSKLEELVAPGAPKAPTASAPNEAGKGRIWTQQEVTELYAKKNEFIKKGKPVPDDLVAAEKDLFKAQTDGRLR